MNPTQHTIGGTPIYEREGRQFVQSGIGTIGWGVYPMWNEIDFDGNVIGNPYQIEEWIFPDPVKVAARQAEQESERARLELAAQFPVEGMSGEYRDDLKGLYIWRTAATDGDYMHLWIDKCGFCDEEKHTVSVIFGYDSMEVCRDCLDKMFDAFEAKVLSA